jgi:hypothetical protein
MTATPRNHDLVGRERIPVAAEEHFTTGRGGAGLWSGILLPPIAFLVAVETAYLLVPWACEKGRHGVVYLGLLPGFAILAVGAVAAWRARRRMGEGLGDEFTGEGGDVAVDPAPSRIRFMATIGLLSSGLFLLLLLSLAIPIAMLHPCD